MGGIAFCLEGTHTQTGFCRDNDNSILEPPSYSSGEKEKCSRGRHGTGGLAAILNSLPIPFPWGWSHSQCTVEVKRFCEEEWLVQGLRARRSRAGIQSQRSISLPNPHSFWRAKVNTTQNDKVYFVFCSDPWKSNQRRWERSRQNWSQHIWGPVLLTLLSLKAHVSLHLVPESLEASDGLLRLTATPATLRTLKRIPERKMDAAW